MAWFNMHARCREDAPTPDRDRYFARGIRVCVRWSDYATFLRDMGECPADMTLERVDNDKGYSPRNCRWATRAEQARNRRSNVVATVGGVTMHGQDWARTLGVSKNAFYTRARRYGAEAAVRHYQEHGVRNVKGKNA